MKFMFRVAFYVVALLMLYTMYSDITGDELSTEHGSPPLVYDGQLPPFGSLQDSGADADFLLDHPKLMYDFIVSRMGQNDGAASVAPTPGIYFSPESETQTSGAIALPRSLFPSDSPEDADPLVYTDSVEHASVEREPAPEMKLMGIISGRRGNLAIINDQIWQEGDQISGGKIIRIKDTKIMIMDDDGRVFFIGM